MTAPQAHLASTTVGLDDVVDDIVLRDLEPTIAALASLIDRGIPRTSEVGEPDGYDGIDRDGEIDHLLPSEWLLIGEEPDEFLRRYDRRELSYLRRRRVEPRATPTSLVVFDTGPAQLGRPRIAHLALLIVLARRAADADVPLRWGTLADHFRRPVTAQAIGDLSKARTSSPSHADHADLIADDALVVTPAAVASTHQLLLTDAGNDVEATLIDHRTGAEERSLIPLPDDAACIRVLRNPLGLRRVTDRPLHDVVRSTDMRPESNLVFDDRENKLLCRTADGRSLLLFPSPNSINEVPGRVRLFEAPTEFPEIVAAGRRKKFAVALQIIDGQAFVSRRGPSLDWLPHGKVPIVDWTPLASTGPPPLGRLWIEDRTLHAVVDGQHLVGYDDRFVAAGPIAHLPWTRSHGHTQITVTPEPWRITHEGGDFEPDVGDGEVLGCGILPGAGPGVLVIGDDRRAIRFVGADSSDTVAYAPGDVLDATAARRRDRVAVRTERGEVVVWDWTTGFELYRWSP